MPNRRQGVNYQGERESPMLRLARAGLRRLLSPGRQGAADPPLHTSSAIRFRLEAHAVIDGVAELLLASEVAFGDLDGTVP